MARLIPLILIGLAVFFWLRARRKTAAYMASYEYPAGAHREGDEVATLRPPRPENAESAAPPRRCKKRTPTPEEPPHVPDPPHPTAPHP